MADKKISELDLALLINNDAEFPFSQDNAGEPTTFKGRITQLGTKIAEDITFSNLRTTSKKLVGAINELLSLGNPIILGTSAPSSSQGANGNLYIQYTEGTGGADDEIDGIFVKIDGAWCEIQTGGGSGTTDYEDLSNKPQVNSVELVGNKSLDDLGIMPASLSKTVSGSIAHFTDGADNIPVKSIVSQIVAVESGNGEKSPTNPYTISGFDSGIITRCGKNLFDPSKIRNGYFLTDGFHDYADWKGICIPVKSGETYVISGMVNQAGGVRYAYIKDRNNLYSEFQLSWGSTTINGTFTVPAGFNGFWVPLATPNLSANIQIEKGSTATPFEAYNGNDYTFTFGQTVYGGHFDNKGNLVNSRGKLDLSSLNWRYSPNGYFEASINIDCPTVTQWMTQNGNCGIYTIINMFYITNPAERVNNSIAWYSNVIRVADNSTTDVSTFVAKLQNQFVCYELATPITLSITSQDIPTLLGENNIFSNTGDVEVDYYTDKADEIVEVSKATASTPLHSYSTDEQVVGTWIDGSTIYEKTFDLGSDINIDYTSWTETSISWQTLNVNRLVGTEGFTSSGGTFAGTLLASKKSNGNIEIQTPRNGTATGVRYLTLRYTKSST
jgi:hypothetical protein